MKDNENMKIVAIAYSLLVGGLSLVAFLLADNLDAIFWLSYIFTVISSFGLFVAAEYYLTDIGRSLKEFPANFIIGKFALSYFIIEIIILVLFGMAYRISEKYYFSIHFIALIVSSVALIVSSLGIKAINSLGREPKIRVANIRQLCADVEAAMQTADNVNNDVKSTVAKKMQEVYEAIKFSDPMVDESLSAMDEQIRRDVYELSYEVGQMVSTKTTDLTRFDSIVKNIKQVLKDRNSRNKILK